MQRRAPPGFNNLVSRKAHALAELLRHHVVPLFSVDNEGNPDFEGSGVLVLLDGYPLVVSAAHVFDHLSSGVHLLLKGREQTPLESPHRVTLCTPPLQRNADLYDLGWCPLTQDEYAAADPLSFITLEDPVEIPAEWFYRYLVIGYPAKDQVPNHMESVYHIQQTYYSGPRLRSSKARQAGLDTSSTIALEFAHNRIVGPRGAGGRPNFRGMSGGGIWRFSPYEEYSAERPPPLVGFLAGSPPKNLKALFGGSGQFLRLLVAEAAQATGYCHSVPANTRLEWAFAPGHPLHARTR